MHGWRRLEPGAGSGGWDGGSLGVIETASNQAFVFASNKQAVNVGASELIFQVGSTWVPEAVEQLRKREPVEVEEVVLASGKALLIADTEEHGRSIIRVVTERALREAPGLPVWGVVDPEPLVDDADRGRHIHVPVLPCAPSAAGGSLSRGPTRCRTVGRTRWWSAPSG